MSVLIWYFYFKKPFSLSSKTSIKWQHIAYIIIPLNLIFINLQQEQPDINGCLVHRLKYFAKGNYEFAIEDFNIAIALNSQNPGAYFNRGSTSYKKGDLAHAIVDPDIAITLNSQNQRARHLHDEAHEELEKSTK